MGTNYYCYSPLKNVCEHCGRGDKSEESPLHIGKSSAGWCFSLHIHPELGIHNLEGWKEHLAQPGFTVRDEYGDPVSVEDLLKTITERKGRGPRDSEWLEDNRAEEGPNGLARHRIDGRYVVGHGEGTWDHLVGKFC